MNAGSKIGRRCQILGLMALTTMLVGCGPSIMSQAQQKSPDGKLVAIARSQLVGPGFGQDVPETIVEIRGPNYQETPKTILLLTHEYPTIPISLKWLSPTQLSVVYSRNKGPGDHVVVVFQAVRWGDVDITAMDLSGTPEGR